MNGRTVRRTFVDIVHGQLHCRIAGDLADTQAPPLLLLHGGPGSSAGLMPLLTKLSALGHSIIAPDMMGNGQSDPPPLAPDVAFYAECTLDLLDQLGVQRVHCYGHHFGAQLACELAIRASDRVVQLILDGVGLFSAGQRCEFLTRYAPPVEPDPTGSHVDRLWRFLSDTTVRFPHYSKDPADLITGGGPLPSPALTDILADVVRNWRTYALTYRAGFSEDVATRLPLVNQPTVLLEVAGDPLARYVPVAIALVPNGRTVNTARENKADAIDSALKFKIS